MQMKRIISISIILTLVAMVCISCEDSSTGPKTTKTATAVYVLNAIGTTISVIDLESGDVTNDVATTGTWPNQVVYRNGKVYCVNSGSNNIQIFNAETWAEETPIDLGDGHNPMNMVFKDDNTAYVACSVSNTVLKVDISNKTVSKEISTGVGTTDILYLNGMLYATNTAFDGSNYTYGQGTVSVIDASSDAVTKTINVSKNPQEIAVDGAGMIHVACSGDYGATPGGANVIDPATNKVTKTLVTGSTPGLLAISTPDNLAYLGVWGMGAIVYNTSTMAVSHDTSNYFLGKGGTGLLTDPDGNIFISVWDDDQVVKCDKDGTVLATYDVGDSPSSLTMKVSAQ